MALVNHPGHTSMSLKRRAGGEVWMRMGVPNIGLLSTWIVELDWTAGAMAVISTPSTVILPVRWLVIIHSLVVGGTESSMLTSKTLERVKV